MNDPNSGKERVVHSPLRFIPYAVDVWCVLLPAADLSGNRIRKVTVLGLDYAVFRDAAGEVHCVEDRCPHRGIELSLGSIEAGHIRCVYHGWRIDGASARVLRQDGCLSDEPSCLRRIALRERYGLVWGFIGDPDRAADHPLPEIAGYDEKNSVDILIRKPVAAHWSYAFDNGVDLYHYGLHANVPFFFRILSLESFTSQQGYFRVQYRAIMPDYLGRNREGDLVIHATSNLFRLDMGEHQRVHGLITPVSADGRQLDMWWFISIFAPQRLRAGLRLLRPLFNYQIGRGFNQDVSVLESEQRAFNRGLRGQRETNPAVLAAHDYLNRHIADRAMAMAPSLAAERLPVDAILPQALKGELGVVLDDGGEASIIDPEQEEDRLRALGDGEVEVRRYQHFVVLRS